MPPAVSGAQARTHGVKTQAHHAREEIVLRLFHLAMPWALWLAVAVLAAVLRLSLAPLGGPWPVVIVAVPGCIIAVLDLHLRAHRAALLGRWIGPVTVVAAAGWLAAAVGAGWSMALLDAWLVGGLLGCISWDAWLAHGDHHDLARAFTPAAEAAGIGGSRLTGIRRARNATRAKIQFPRGAVTTRDAAGQAENLEGALGYAPGSWAITGDRDDAGVGDLTITDPRLLDRAPVDWPGPSAPGQSVAEPFREGSWADGEEFRYSVLPLHHVRETGCTGSGKTLSWYSHFAEGITRHDYACLAADITKGEQFLGPLRPALHWLAIEPEDAVEMLLAVHRVVRARCDYLGRKRMTEWRPGCGLTYLEVREEETPDIIALLDPSKTKRDPGVMYLRDWISDKRASRTAGVAWWDSYQRADATQLPTIARGQMGRRCFGVMESQDAEFGLSELQRERGCRPQLWGAGLPGKAYTDTLTIPEERKTLPLRFYWWGPDSHRAAAFASEWPASRRPLDDVTGEALEARAPRPASSAFPVREPALAGASGAQAGSNGHQAGANGSAAAATLSSSSRPASYKHRISPEEALRRVRAQLGTWKAEGKKFTVRHLINAVGEEVVCPRDCGNPACTGRSRAWLYDRVSEMVRTGLLAEAGGHPATYTVTGDPEGETS